MIKMETHSRNHAVAVRPDFLFLHSSHPMFREASANLYPITEVPLLSKNEMNSSEEEEENCGLVFKPFIPCEYLCSKIKKSVRDL